MGSCTALGPDRIKPEHLKCFPLVTVKTLTTLFTQYLSECKVLTSCKIISREYKTPLCLTSIDLQKAFDTVETEAAIGALGNRGVPTHIRMLRQLYDNFTVKISPFYREVIINVKRCVRQRVPSRPTFSSALERITRHLEREDLGVKVDGRYPHPLCFADDIVLITPNIEQAKRMLAESDSACGKIGLRLNLTKMMSMKLIGT
uniref:Reverse transcriptase domain-containing protein n=1 Tax=Haemonchus contortus TaxID=6289 RepID=A0A7I4Z238_HAECO